MPEEKKGQKNLSKKRKALKSFEKGLLKTPAKQFLEKIILYGSLAWGKPTKESDIDIVLISKKPKLIDKLSEEIAFQTLLRHGELIEPLVYSKKEYQSPKSAILMKAILHGKEVYSKTV